MSFPGEKKGSLGNSSNVYNIIRANSSLFQGSLETAAALCESYSVPVLSVDGLGGEKSSFAVSVATAFDFLQD